MEIGDNESGTNDEKRKKNKFIIKAATELKDLEQQDLLSYVEELHDMLKKKDKKIKKFKEKIKELLKELEFYKATKDPDKSRHPAESEDVHKPGDEEASKVAETTDATSDVCSFVDEIRQAAEQAQNLNGFVYEPTSGLYYDQKTGYYYNAEYGLYYDGNNGCYYKYNAEKNVFEFHSQVEMPSVKTSPKANSKDDAALANYDYDGIDDDNDEVVEFDEWGVITDNNKLQQIRKDKEKQQRKYKKESRRLKKKSSKNKEKKSKELEKRKKRKEKKSLKQKEQKHKLTKRKHSQNKLHSNSASNDTDAEGTAGEEDKNNKHHKKKPRQDIEDGELSSSSSSSSSNSSCSSNSSSCSKSGHRSSVSDDSTSLQMEMEEKNSGVPFFYKGSRFQDIAKKYPPSLRVIVQETNLDTLKVGSLHLITFKGGSLGREGNHDVIIPDVNVSKSHLKFHYDIKKSIYRCTDMGSRNGSILNGTRMSISKTESDAYDLVHGSVIQIGQTKLLCHIHEGNSTCGLCEPGLLIETVRESTNANTTGIVALTHKEQLKKIQKKYGLENEKFVDNKQSGGSYNDRAATRRIQVGSSNENEKTQTASVNTEISSENKGFKMLSKLGWSKGEALGKTNVGSGLLEPINVSSNEGKKGLGCEDQLASVSGVPFSNVNKKKMDTWKKTQERYQKADIFSVSDDSN